MNTDYSLTRKACYLSYIVQAIAINTAPLFFVIFKREYGLTVSNLGFLVFFGFLIQLLMDVLSIKLIRLFGYRKMALFANITAFSGMLALSFLPRTAYPFFGLIAAFFLYSVGAGIIEIVINPLIDSLPDSSGAVALSLLHSFYSWGQAGVILISSILIFLLGERNWYILPIVWSAVPLVNTFLFLRVPIIESDSPDEKLTVTGILKNRFFIIFLFLMICAGSGEMVISQWSSYFAETALGVSKVAGDIFGPCSFAIMMALGRTLYGRFGSRIPIVKSMMVCSFFCFFSYIGITFFNNPAAVMMCFAAAGLSISLVWPGTLSAASGFISGEKTSVFALLALAGDVGCSFGPWINGAVSDIVENHDSLKFLDVFGFSPEQTSLRTALLVSSVFPLIMLIFTVVLMKISKNKK